MTIVERGITTENYALAETTVRELRVVLARLSPEQRQVISLRLAGLSSGQICSVMGKSSSWVALLRHSRSADCVTCGTPGWHCKTSENGPSSVVFRIQPPTTNHHLPIILLTRSRLSGYVSAAHVIGVGQPGSIGGVDGARVSFG